MRISFRAKSATPLFLATYGWLCRVGNEGRREYSFARNQRHRYLATHGDVKGVLKTDGCSKHWFKLCVDRRPWLQISDIDGMVDMEKPCMWQGYHVYVNWCIWGAIRNWCSIVTKSFAGLKMVYSTTVLCVFVKQSEVLSICSCAGEIIVQCTSVAWGCGASRWWGSFHIAWKLHWRQVRRCRLLCGRLFWISWLQTRRSEGLHCGRAETVHCEGDVAAENQQAVVSILGMPVCANKRQVNCQVLGSTAARQQQ